MSSFKDTSIDDLDSFLISGVDPVKPGLENVTIGDDDEYVCTPTEESAIFLDAIASECATVDEFYTLVEENAVEWEMCGLIEDASVALEAVKRMKIDNWRDVNRGRVAGSEAIRMAKRDNSPDYKKYKKYRDLYFKYKKKIEKKYGNRAKIAARRSIANSQRKSACVKSAQGAGITKKLDTTIKKLDKDGRNGTAIKESGK